MTNQNEQLGQSDSAILPETLRVAAQAVGTPIESADTAVRVRVSLLAAAVLCGTLAFARVASAKEPALRVPETPRPTLTTEKLERIQDEKRKKPKKAKPKARVKARPRAQTVVDPPPERKHWSPFDKPEEKDPFAASPASDPFSSTPERDPFKAGASSSDDPFARHTAPAAPRPPDPFTSPAAPDPHFQLEPEPAPTPPTPPPSPPETIGGDQAGPTTGPSHVPPRARESGESSLSDSDVERIYQTAAPATVRLTITFEDGTMSSCSGYIIEPGVIATARHCMEHRYIVAGGSKKIKKVVAEWPAAFDPKTGEITALYLTEAMPVGFSQGADTGFIVLPPNVSGPTPLSTGDIKKGHSVAFIGHPQGAGWAITTGRVSQIIINGTGRITFEKEARRGNSGGPVLNGSGKVVGTTVYGDPQDDQGFAVPIATTLATLRDIVSKGWIDDARKRLGRFDILRCAADVGFHDYAERTGPGGKAGQTVEISSQCTVVGGDDISDVRRLLESLLK